MPQVSLRLVEAAKERLDSYIAEHGLRIRGAIEGAIECFLDTEDNPAERSPAELRVHEAIWERARSFDELAACGGLKDQRAPKLNVDLDEDIHARVKSACGKRDISVNALVSAGFAPIDSWGGPDEDAAMEACWQKAVILARRRDYARRLGKLTLTD